MPAGGQDARPAWATDHEVDIADASLAGAGAAQVQWAAARMPVLGTVRRRFADELPFSGLRVGACLHVTAETAVLLSTLAAGGAQVSVCASNPLSTKDEVAAALADSGIATFARRGERPAQYVEHVDAVLARRPHLTIDDGCDLVARLHGEVGHDLSQMVGGTEDTTTGASHLRALHAAGGLKYPIVALTSSVARALADNRYGTGQSTLDGITRATNTLLAGSVVVVAGYGNCGRGIAERARGLGARVIVTEVDPLRALEAVLDGYDVLPMEEAAKRGRVFVTATGNRDVIGSEHFAVMQDGAILANAGHFDVEIDVRGLAQAAGADRGQVRPMVEEFVVEGRRLLLLCEGRLVNLGAADGNPAQVMDIAFAVQALACEWLVAAQGRLPVGVHEVVAAIDAEVARLKIVTSGTTIDTLSQQQIEYLASFSK